MATRILGLEIHNEYLAAVLLEQRGTVRVVVSSAHFDLEEGEDLGTALASFLGQHSFQGNTCILGLPLSLLSLRNLFLPFPDRKKISQVLPLELEEQLLLPMSEQVVDFVVTSRQEGGSFLLVGAVEKSVVRTLLSALQHNGLRVDGLMPTVSTRAEVFCSAQGAGKTTLFLSAERHGLELVLWSAGQAVFMRRISYPEDFSLPEAANGPADPSSPDAASAHKSIVQICAAIRFSLSYVQHDFGENGTIAQAVVFGWPEGTSWQQGLAEELKVEVIPCPALCRQGGRIRLDEELQDEWRPGRFDGALALALAGLAKKQGGRLNFLQGEFVRTSWQFFSKRSLLAAALVLSLFCALGIGALWFDCHTLETRSLTLHQKMTALFKQTFPEVTRIVDPYVQMQSKLREARGSEVSLPLFSGDKRVLEILTDISSRVPKTLSLHVFRLVIDQKSVQIKGLTDAYNNVNVIKSKLALSTRYQEVKIISATADKDKGSIRFEIRLQLAEAS